MDSAPRRSCSPPRCRRRLTGSHEAEKESFVSRSSLLVLSETEEWIVVDKPAFLEVHPSKPNGPVTLWDKLREVLAYEIANGGQVSIINRLDRETSGVTLIAKTRAAA